MNNNNWEEEFDRRFIYETDATYAGGSAVGNPPTKVYGVKYLKQDITGLKDFIRSNFTPTASLVEKIEGAMKSIKESPFPPENASMAGYLLARREDYALLKDLLAALQEK